jgi:hypothetical protein
MLSGIWSERNRCDTHYLRFAPDMLGRLGIFGEEAEL